MIEQTSFTMDSLFLVLVLLGGIGLGYYFRKFQARKKIGTAESKAERLLEEAKQKQKELVLAAKDHAIKITEEAKKQETEIRQQILRLEQRLEKKETEVDNRRKELENFQRTLEKERENIKVLKEELTANREKQLATLEKIAKLTREEARQVLIEQTEKQVKDELSGLTRKLVLQAHEDAEREARDIIAQAIERVSSEVSTETTTTIVDLPNEEMKGRIIGKEGRNIKAFEQMLGVEVIVDETPDAVVISGFNSVRRYVAKVTLEKLIKDGRTGNPARPSSVWGYPDYTALLVLEDAPVKWFSAGVCTLTS